MSTFYGVTNDYEYTATHKREKLNLWSGAFSSTWEGVAMSLPKGDGYMVTTYNGDKVRVICPTPRNDQNYQDVDRALGTALEAHYQTVGALPIADPRDACIDHGCGFGGSHSSSHLAVIYS